MMNRIILKFENIDDIHSIHGAVDEWNKHRPPTKSLKLTYQRGGQEIVIYDKGWKDAMIVTYDRTEGRGE